jgi:hypothetical protein
MPKPSKPRKDRKDMTVKAFEEKHGLPPGSMRNDDGRDARGDKLVGTIRKEHTKKGKK